MMPSSRPRRTPPLGTALTWLFVLTASAAIIPSLQRHSSAQEPDDDVEEHAVFRASQLLPRASLRGANFRIREQVENNGMFNVFTFDSDYGTFQVEGTQRTKARVHELRALEVMERMSKSELFVSTATKTATAPLRFGGKLIRDPLRAVRDVRAGVESMLDNVGDAVFGDPRDESDPAMRELLGVSRVKRTFAYEFGIDPYTEFAPVQKKLGEIGRTAFAAKITVSAAFAAVPGGAGLVLSGTKFGASMNELLRDKSPRELKEQNRQRLTAMGVQPQVADLFLEQPAYSPTQQTYLVGALQRLPGVKDKTAFLRPAALASNATMAFYYRRMAEMLAAYHEKVKPIDQFVLLAKVPAVQTRDGVVVMILPFDHLAWTESLVERSDGSAAQAVQRLNNVTSQELWVEGTASERARQELGERGWVVRDKAGEQLTLE